MEVSGMEIQIELAYDCLDQVALLFAEYTREIRALDPDVSVCLDVQHCDQELRTLGEKYGPPGGRLYVARLGGEPAGCAALRGLDLHTCEIKRLYVRPEYRGRHIGALLAERAVADARAMGYRRMRLDTFPFMEEALSLYRRMGFHSIPRYNDNPAQSAVFLQLDL